MPRYICLKRWFFETSEFPINVLDIQFHLGNAKTFWNGTKKHIFLLISTVEPFPKRFGISQMGLNYRNID